MSENIVLKTLLDLKEDIGSLRSLSDHNETSVIKMVNDLESIKTSLNAMEDHIITLNDEHGILVTRADRMEEGMKKITEWVDAKMASDRSWKKMGRWIVALLTSAGVLFGILQALTIMGIHI